MLILKIDWGQLTEYPFNVQIWGTVSDWLMVLVTGLTAWYLIKTFREQQKSNDILGNKERREVLPIFEVDPIPFKEEEIWFLNISLTESPAFEIFFHMVGVEMIEDSTKAQMKPSDTQSLYIPHVEQQGLYHFGETLIGSIEFRDIDRRKYNQTLIKRYGSYIINHPELID